MKNEIKDPMVFKNAVSMKMTKEQFESEIEPTMIELGYKIIPIVLIAEWLVFATNWNGIDNAATFVDHLNKKLQHRQYIETYDPKLFLSLASEKIRRSELNKIRKGDKSQITESI